jgi:cytochrome b6-f complex iron-sulfur subunit
VNAKKNNNSDSNSLAENGSESSATLSRRSFFSWLWLGLGTLVSAETLWLIFSFLRPRKTGAEKQNVFVVAGPAEQFLPNSVTAFPEGKFYLARLEDGGFIALGRECTHLGCTVTWEAEKGRFLCPCHASAFDIRGEVVKPPAPRSLDFYAVMFENREVKVDLARRSRRTAFDPSQVAYL